MRTLVYHLGAANPVRTYPPAQGAEFIRLFLTEFADWQIKVVGLNSRINRTEPGNAFDEEGEMLSDGNLSAHSRVDWLVDKTEDFMDLRPILQAADLLVCPDSAVMHLSAADSLPTISLWGPFDPNDRIQKDDDEPYYPKIYPIRGTGCTKSPCRTHSFSLPVDLCRSGGCEPFQPDGKTLGWCGSLASITPEMILEKCREAITPPR